MRTLLAICILSACGTTASAADWSETTSKAGKFKVSFPGKPQTMKRTLSTAVGKIDLHMFILPTMGNRAVYAVMYNDYPAIVTQTADPNTVLERALNGAVKSKNGTITKKANIKIDGFPGKDVTFEGSSGGKKLTGFIRVYLVNSRLYQLLVFQQEGVKLSKADIEKFQNSFRRIAE